ncbi:MAG: family 16 glycosylhydrolase [Saprospiraceae bacterium]|uniref:Family 16 glycosylhydrolase n=1 Tax=Candidatus Opimibacter skivensis TaxID=2982028 RepID=A0A9D7SZ50_9BACT|nr:family 16 glycosylhydrolase [Candidatus Opimibacter skivensis]
MISRKYNILIVSLGICLLSFISSCIDESDGTAGKLNLPVLHVSDVTTTEGDEDKVIHLDITLTGDNTTNVIVTLAAIPGSAVTPDDYTLLNGGQIIFLKGETTKTIDIKIKADEGKEPQESFQLKLYNPQNCTIEKDLILVTINDDDDNVAGLNIPSGGASSPDHYDGYNLVWRDEFVGDVLNSADWSFETGNGCPDNCGWGNNESQYYRSDNTSIVNGHLVITAKKQQYGGFDYTSSRLVTKGKQQFKFGRIDIRAALPQGKGIWPALWMLGSNVDAVSWPACGEIDIMELTGDFPNRVVGTVHYGANLAQHQYNSVSKFTSGNDSYQENFTSTLSIGKTILFNSLSMMKFILRSHLQISMVSPGPLTNTSSLFSMWP